MMNRVVIATTRDLKKCPLTERTAFLDVTGGLDNGQDWVSGPDMGKRLNGHCLAGIDENRVLIMGGKWNGPPGVGWNNDGLETILYDLSANPM